ncbi:MAG: DUF1549 domain-containing protein, partial [Planctomycetota bacterium]|nr:DUF1549 domain-containing protein [Planctomycetota bacterium]
MTIRLILVLGLLAGVVVSAEPEARQAPHWAYLPLNTLAPSGLPDPGRTRNPIDHFVTRRLERLRIAPAPVADRSTLIRRVTLDLTGLLPEPADVARFLADRRPGAWERVVDRLLASPHY